MTTHKQRMLAVMRGETVDEIPFAPRLDLWWMSNMMRGTLPEKYKGKKHHDIARAEGWAIYGMVPDFTNMMRGPQDILHRSIGLFDFKQSVYGWKFPKDVEVKTRSERGQQIIEYITPVGTVRTVGGLTDEMKRAGASLGWTQEHAIQKPEDYKVVGYIFENMEVFPQNEGFNEYTAFIGEDGVFAAGGPSLAASPMHHIQKEFMDPTKFFFEYRDNGKSLAELEAQMTHYYDKVLAIIENSPAEVVLWGANYDDMLTYPPYFEKEILPWLQKASQRLRDKGKMVSTHTDGENFGLMDLIRDCGANVAESVTPYPMTKVTIGEYYRRWRDKLCIMGGIPECVLLEETATDGEFEAYMDDLFRSIAPGNNIVLGIADSTPPNAVFDRILRIRDRVGKEGKLPLAGSAPDWVARPVQASTETKIETGKKDGRLEKIGQAVIDGDVGLLEKLLGDAVRGGMSAYSALNDGMISAMELIGERFKTGDIFIPEVLTAARAMNAGLKFLEPHFVREGKRESVVVMIGTVAGDMHDIGKNMVATMLKGVGFDVVDLGINVSAEEFVRRVVERKPEVLAISALLTSTMPQMKLIIDALKAAGIRDNLKIIVGGAPVNAKFAKDVGADAYAPNASEAISVVKSLTLKKD